MSANFILNNRGLLIGFLLTSGFIIGYSIFSNCANQNGRYGLFSFQKEKVNFGYTLITPYNLDPEAGQGKVYLIDLWGRAVHTWQSDYQVFAAHIKKNGNLVIAGATHQLNSAPGGGTTGILQELDWDSNVVWEYKNPLLHHDFEILPNGNIAALIWDEVPQNIRKLVSGGVNRNESSDKVWSDAVIEINRDGKVVWEWHFYEHLDPASAILGPLTPRTDWTHANSIRYITEDPISGEEGYLISARHTDEIYLINRDAGEIIWRYGNNGMAHQHDASMLPNGNILVFDNGLYQKPPSARRYGARILEINPRDNKVMWEFMPGKTGLERSRFAASIMGSAQRLENGNTLIGNGLQGHVFEITPTGEVVWDFYNPFFSYSTGPWPNNAFFQARRYGINEISWPDKLPNPDGSKLCRFK